MRTSMLYCSLSLALLGWAVVGHAAAVPRSLAFNSDKETTLYVSPGNDAERAQANWQWVGSRRKGTDSCPEVPGWEVHDWLNQALIEPQRTLDPRRAAEDYELLQSLGLDRLCVYRATTDGMDLDLGNHLPLGLESAKRDRMALAPTSPLILGAAGQITWRTLADQLLLQAGKKSETGRDLFPAQYGNITRGDNPGVRLVFLDTQPDGEGVPASPGKSEHGYTLAHLARHLVCSESGYPQHCAATIATRLALPYTEFDSNKLPTESMTDSQGGSLGLVNELAQTIVREVWAWRQSHSQQHLILNLSLGWDGELFGDLKAHRASQLDPAVWAVYKALRFARSEGVLVIAAAGNYRGGEVKSGWPLLPAAWELRRPAWFPFVFGPKRVYAVGGVDSLGLPLPNSRDGGRPRRTAYGDHAVASAASSSEPTAIYTGTSVSAAVTSSIAAVVWHLRPELSPAEVMKLIGRAGDRLESPADYYAWKNLWPLSSLIPPPQMTRLSLCTAVREACGPNGDRCNVPPPSVSDCRWLPKAPDLSALVTPSSPLPEMLSQEHPSQGSPVTVWPDMPSRRWLVPTPEDNPCPGCSIVPPSKLATAAAIPGTTPTKPGDYVLAMELNPKWVPADVVELKSAVLTINHYDATGKMSPPTTYTIASNDLGSLVTTKVFLYVLDGEHKQNWLARCTATIDFKVVRNARIYSYQSPVVVDP